MLGVLIELPVRPGVTAHSIVSVKGGEEEKEGGSDGVVKYESAHLEGVASELIVDSPHSCQSKPRVIEELLRILLLHLEEESEESRSASAAQLPFRVSAPSERTRTTPHAAWRNFSTTSRH
jgi:hypothetical protein